MFKITAFGSLKQLSPLDDLRKTELPENRFSFTCSEDRLQRIVNDVRNKKKNPYAVMCWEEVREAAQEDIKKSIYGRQSDSIVQNIIYGTPGPDIDLNNHSSLLIQPE